MSFNVRTTPQEEGGVVLRVSYGAKGSGLELATFKSYSFNSHYTTPTDGWSFTMGDETLSNALLLALAPGQPVTLTVGEHLECAGTVDKLSITSNRQGGTEVTVEGRDVLSPSVDAGIDPRIKFTPEMKLLDLLRAVFGPFGWPGEASFLISNDDNRNVMTGKSHGTKTSKKGKPLKEYNLHLLKPNDNERAFEFAARVANRFGLWVRPSADGASLIVAKPDFDQEPLYRVSHLKSTGGTQVDAAEQAAITGSRNNILTATVTRDCSAQPSVIFASGFGTGGENPRDQFTLGVVNPAIRTDNTAILASYPKTRILDKESITARFLDAGDVEGGDFVVSGAAASINNFARPLFLHDDNSKNMDELESFLRRELALRMRKAFTYTFEVLGHEYVAPDGSKIPWAVDTVVSVNDQICDVQEDLWILSRTFTKSRTAGTRTKLECIRLHTLEF